MRVVRAFSRCGQVEVCFDLPDDTPIGEILDIGGTFRIVVTGAGAKCFGEDMIDVVRVSAVYTDYDDWVDGNVEISLFASQLRKWAGVPSLLMFPKAD